VTPGPAQPPWEAALVSLLQRMLETLARMHLLTGIIGARTPDPRLYDLWQGESLQPLRAPRYNALVEPLEELPCFEK
jgi:hypothetical protein